MLRKIAIAIVVLLAAFVVFAATRPDTFRVERAASIKAPPEKIFAILNDFRQWGAWSPWEKKDPAIVDFALEPRGDSTNVTWTLHGPMPFISKVISIFCSMDSMIGRDFDAGLANLKAAAE